MSEKLKREERAVIRAAIRWYDLTEQGTVRNFPQRVASYNALRKACAALRKRRGRGK